MRDDLCVTVPSFFQCPISLDVMKSPVSLSTGVTYDRESIQRWLDGGNNTCPATMQVLQSKELVPNFTLHRLIQIWSESVRHRRVDSAAPKVLTWEQVASLIKSEKFESDEFVIDSLSKVVCFARDCGENRRFLAAESTGFVPFAVEILSGENARRRRAIEALEMAVRALDMIRSEIVGVVKQNLACAMIKKNLAASLVQVLQRGSVDSRIGSARILELIASDDEESKLAIAETDELLSELLKLISPEKDASLIDAGLASLITVASLRRARARIVRLGAVRLATKCLSKASLSSATAEKALHLLEASASAREGWREIAGDGECVERIVERVLKVSRPATEHAVTVLWSVCCATGSGSGSVAAAAAAKANGEAKMLLLIQTDCSPAVRRMAADLLKVFRLCAGSKPSSAFGACYDTNTTHIMPF